MKKSKTKLSVFDFDGTLMATPLPDTGKDLYKKNTGKDWPHKGWFSKPESLCGLSFDIKPIKDVHDDYLTESKNGSMLVMLTGRLSRLEREVKTLLSAHDMVFDEYLFNTGGDTLTCKIKSLNDILDANPSIVEVEMWDDRITHIPSFEEWGKEKCLSGRLTDFKINVVPTTQTELW